jgi:short-subunit dehydrogenase
MGAASAPRTALEAYRAMMAGKPMIVHGTRNKLVLQLLRLSPRAAVRAVAAALNPPPQKTLERAPVPARAGTGSGGDKT